MVSLDRSDVFRNVKKKIRFFDRAGKPVAGLHLDVVKEGRLVQVSVIFVETNMHLDAFF